MAQNGMGAVQLTEFAVNVNGWCLRAPNGPWIDHDIKINAYSPSSTTWTKAIEEAKKKNMPAFRSTLDLTEREKGQHPEEGIQKYTVVGFTYPNSNKEHQKLHPGTNKQRPVGHVALPADGISLPKDCGTDHFVLVVSPVIYPGEVDQTEASIVLVANALKLYALVCPENDLCKPYLISSSQCFYLSRFRDSTTNKSSRSANWNRLVYRASRVTENFEDTLQQKQQRQARGQTKIVFDPVRSLQSELRTVYTNFVAGDMEYGVKEMRKILEQASTDLTNTPALDSQFMRKFVDIIEEDVWTAEDSAALQSELCDLWPDLFQEDDIITAYRLTIMRKAMVEHQIAIPFKQIRYHVAHVCSHLHNTPLDGKSEGEILEEIDLLMHNVSFAQGSPESMPTIPSHLQVSRAECVNLLRTIHSKNIELADLTEKHYADRKAQMGSFVNIDRLDTVWKKYLYSFDVVDAQRLAMDIGRIAVMDAMRADMTHSQLQVDFADQLKRLDLENLQIE